MRIRGCEYLYIAPLERVPPRGSYFRSHAADFSDSGRGIHFFCRLRCPPIDALLGAESSRRKILPGKQYVEFYFDLNYIVLGAIYVGNGYTMDLGPTEESGGQATCTYAEVRIRAHRRLPII